MNTFYDKLMKAFDFDENNRSNRIFIMPDRQLGKQMVFDLGNSVGKGLKVTVITPKQIAMMSDQERGERQFVILENFRYMGVEMDVIDSIPREQITMVIQPSDKELMHLNRTNTRFATYTSTGNEVYGIFSHIAAKGYKPEECVILYTQDKTMLMLEEIAEKMHIPICHMSIPYDVLEEAREHKILTNRNREGILVMPVEHACFTGRNYLYVMGMHDAALPTYDSLSLEILDNEEEIMDAYRGGYAHEVLPLAKLIDVLCDHEGKVMLSYPRFNSGVRDGTAREEDYIRQPAPIYSVLKERINAMIPVVVLSGRLYTDKNGNTEVIRLSISDPYGDVLFDRFIHPYAVECPTAHDLDEKEWIDCIATGSYPHEISGEIKYILGQADVIVTYDEALEAVLSDWGDWIEVELCESKMVRVSDWFTVVYGEMEQDRRVFKEQSLYTCAKTLGYPKYPELNLGDSMCQCQAIGYCYRKMLEENKR